MIPQQAGFLLGGFNEGGTAELYTIEPAGSIVKVEDYDANFGSGMPYVLFYIVFPINQEHKAYLNQN